MKYFLILFILILSIVAKGQVSFNIDSINVWRDVNIEMDGRNRTYNEIWGFAQGNREYGVIGSREGTYVVDITNVKQPVLVKFIPGAFNDGTNRDYHDFNGYLYMVCDQGPSSLQIADLHYLPDSLPVVYDSDNLFSNCHNIFIDSLTSHLYACGVTIKMDAGENKRVDLQIFDLSNSFIPDLLLTYDVENRDEFHDIFVKNDTAIGNNVYSGLFFYDFTDLLNPKKKFWDITVYDDQGVNHSGYATEDGQYYYFADETKGTDLKAVNLDGYQEPFVVDYFNAGVHKNDIVAHNLLVRDSFLFVSYYHEGLQIFDISNPSKPQKVGHYQTYTNTVVQNPDDPPVKDYSGWSGAWGVYPFLPSGYILVSDREKGMFILDISQLDGKLHPELLPPKTVFPNPFNDHIVIVFPYNQVVKIEVFSINGSLIERSASFEEFNRSTRIYFKQNLNSGLYILKVEARNESFTIKIMKE